ncbi:ATP-binding protein [Myxococcus sp. K15C18031901]|uniref:ATP-binding response regulator n=1 Tax=Myxococcus dinghuensis TaxID=2906761 RepID=UPI0020A71B7D|nr:ATP-binding protein [Myxococcus dinghuensis]MCP3103453.1 ATP-binding protein [Myxococcus dinghuensis]
MEDSRNQGRGDGDAQLEALLDAMEAVNRGDFSRRAAVRGHHPLLDRLAETFNTGVSRLAAFTEDISRVAREVGLEGRLGAQVPTHDAEGAWRRLGDGVNILASSLTAQVRDLIDVSSAVARGDLSRQLSVEVRGEGLELKNIVNAMVEQLRVFSLEVTRVARKVGVEGGSAEAPGTENAPTGVWKELNDNVGFTEKLALASRNKSEFLANITHELRTPLNSLLILSKALSDNAEHRLGPREEGYARTIHAAGTDLLSLINDILDLSKVEAGMMRVEPADVPLTDIKLAVEREFQHVADHKGLGFGVALSGARPWTVHTDPMRLRQVLKNLLSNAFKFTERGRVELRITSVERGLLRFDSEVLNHADALWAFSVTDTGIGIPQEALNRIFDAFQQAEPSTSHRYGGTGLGLSISRELARLLGGELHVMSEQGRGSTFTLYLPEVYVGAVGGEGLAHAAAHTRSNPVMLESVSLTTHAAVSARELAAFSDVGLGDASSGQDVSVLSAAMLSGATWEVPSAPVEFPRSNKGLSGRRMLVVDDNIREVFSLISVLESRGLELLHAESMGEALVLLRDSPELDAMLLLVPMTDEGYDVVSSVRRDARFGALPIVVVTAAMTEDERSRCLAAGANECLGRPVDLDRVLAFLSREGRE